MPLNSHTPRNEPAIKKVSSGVLGAPIAYMRIDGVVGQQPERVAIPGAGVQAASVCLSAMVQRPFLMAIGLSVEGNRTFSCWTDENAFPSRAALALGTYGPATVAHAMNVYEGTNIGMKLSATAGFIRAYVETFSAQGWQVTGAPPADMLPYLWTRNTNGGLAGGGNHYDCYAWDVYATKSNVFTIRNLLPYGSTRITSSNRLFNHAPYVANNAVNGVCSIDLGERIFPLRMRVELFDQNNAGGRKYADVIIAKAFGGDVYAGRAAAPVPSAPYARAAWILSASAGAGSLNNVRDGNLSSWWGLGNQPTPNVSFFQVDTAAPRLIGSMVMDTSTGASDVPRSGNVLTSLDGIAWTLRASWAQTNINGGIVALAWRPVEARFVKLIATDIAAQPGNWWSIGEFNLYATVP